MANSTIFSKSAIGTIDPANDLSYIYDVSANTDNTVSPNNLVASVFPVWTTFTPTWTSTGTQPAIVNGTIVGHRLTIGKATFFNVNIIAGSSTTFGTGTYSIGGILPANTLVISSGTLMLVSTVIDTGTLRFNAGATGGDLWINGAAVSGTVPRSLASGHVINVAGVIETV